MARLPDKSSRFILISVFVFCSSFLFLDFRFNTFKPIQDFYNSSSIFIKVFSKQVIFSPIYNSASSIVNSRNIKEENEELKAELNYQLIKNYIVSNKSIVNRNIFFGEVDIEKIIAYEKSLHDYANSKHSALMNEINEKLDYNDEIAGKLKDVLDEFKEQGVF